MASIFDLPTEMKQLSSANDGIANLEYDQQPATRNVQGANFPNGSIHFRFETSGTKHWLPSRSYIRMRCKLTTPADTPLQPELDVAWNMGVAANLFQSAEFRVNDKTVSRVSDFLPQVDALETRLTKSKSWLDSTGASTNFWTASHGVRLNDASGRGKIMDCCVLKVGADAVGELGYTNDGNTAFLSYGNDNREIAILKNGGTDLPTGVWQAGDIFQVVAGNFGGVEYKVLVVGLDTANQTTLVVDRVGMPQVQSTGVGVEFAVALGFRRIRPENLARQVQEVELIWQPQCLSIFKVGHALPAMRGELVLNPQTSSVYQKRAIQSLFGDKGSTDFKFEVVDMYLYTAMVEGPRVENLTYLLDLSQTRCQSEKIETASFGQKNLDISPSSHAITVAYQDTRAGTDTRASASVFKTYAADFKDTVDEDTQELGLTRMFIQYNGISKPSPDADPDYEAQTQNGDGIATDYTVQRYAETQIGSGCMFDSGGCETIHEFHQRGSYYYFPWPKDGSSRATRVAVHQGFKSSTDVSNMRMLLFDHSKQVARISIQDSRVTSVELQDA
jgi:hypothetical protein